MLLGSVIRKPMGDEIIGVGRLIKLPGTNEAEFAVVISDQFQGQGTHLLASLVDIGCQEGVKLIVAQILRENHHMQRVAKKVGFEVNYDAFNEGNEGRDAAGRNIARVTAKA